ncbi:MAG: diguanylate cyclase [Myxococcaceae bacterium]|nr:diguanylate cyclase [Myxococcaceae bacterium]
MAFPPHAFAINDGRVYSEWEVHKLSVSGVRKFALAGVMGSAFLILLDALVFRDGRPEVALPGWLPRVSLGLGAGISIAFFAMAQARKVELQRPRVLATLLAFALCAAGAMAAAAAGGLNGPLGFGLVPVLFFWPMLMPGGTLAALAPVGGGVLLHLGVVLGLSDAGLSAEGRALGGVLVMASAAALGTAQAIEHWRGRAAEYSQHDWLTNALSRPFLEERLGALCAQRSRSLAPVSLVMFDLDRFKNINDTWGRGAGDEVLEMLVTGVMAEIRASDFIGRYGGDEFLLVLDECEGNAAMSLLDRLRQRFADKPMTVGDNQVRISFSAGIVSVSAGDPLVVKDLLRNAERALVNSKEAGRNRTAMAPPPPPHEAGQGEKKVPPGPTTNPEETAIGN